MASRSFLSMCKRVFEGIQLARNKCFSITQRAHRLSGIIETEEKDLCILVQQTYRCVAQPMEPPGEWKETGVYLVGRGYPRTSLE